ncbi:MAG: hypothetical protein ACR2QG_03670 [Gammaproteobacteria bacterium]
MSEQADSTSTPEIGSLNGKFTPAAKTRINEYQSSFETFEPTLGLLYGDIEGVVTGKPSWSLAAFDSRSANDTIEMYSSFGAVVLYELDGFTFLIPQISHIKELNSRKIEFVNNRLRPRS